MANAKMKPIKIAAEFMWVNATKANELSGKFQLDCCNLSPEAVKAIEAVGGAVRSREDKPEKGYFFTAKSNFEIPVVDTSGNEIKDPIGNGSKGYIIIQPYPWSFLSKKGVGLGAAKVVVTTLVHYEDGGDESVGDDEVL